MLRGETHEFRPSSTQNDAIDTSAFLHVQADWGGQFIARQIAGGPWRNEFHLAADTEMYTICI